jgi:hypothetical protein
VAFYSLIFVVFCLYKAIKSRHALFLLLRDIVLNLKKFCCWCCRPQIIQPTIAPVTGKSLNNVPHTIINLPLASSAPSEMSSAYHSFAPPSYTDPNLYQTIGNFPKLHSQFPGTNLSSSSLYNQTRTCSTLSIKEEPYESTTYYRA